ncbi:MAG: hypothetical protein JWL79_3607 [Frankiales bacterium]|nr:hypothetical protein [Frankiales bacterium]
MKRPDRTRSSPGFTLIELLLSMTIIGIVLAAVSAALIVFFSNASYSLARDDHSGGAAVLSSYLDRDLASADTVTTGTATPTCGAATGNLLILSWSDALATPAQPSPDPTGGSKYQVAYFTTVDTASIPPGPSPATRYKLERTYCVDGAVSDHSILVPNLLSADFSLSGTSTCGSGTPPATPVTVTLKPYGSDTASNYTYKGCLKARLR